MPEADLSSDGRPRSLSGKKEPGERREPQLEEALSQRRLECYPLVIEVRAQLPLGDVGLSGKGKREPSGLPG